MTGRAQPWQREAGRKRRRRRKIHTQRLDSAFEKTEMERERWMKREKRREIDVARLRTNLCAVPFSPPLFLTSKKNEEKNSFCPDWSRQHCPRSKKKKEETEKKFLFHISSLRHFFSSSTEHQQDTQPSLARPPPMENPLNFYKDIVRPHRRKKNWIIYTKRTILWTLTYLCEMANYAMHFLWVFCWV